MAENVIYKDGDASALKEVGYDQEKNQNGKNGKSGDECRKEASVQKIIGKNVCYRDYSPGNKTDADIVLIVIAL